MNVNIAIVAGRITMPFEIRKTLDGNVYTKIRVATNFRKKSDEEDKVEFHTIVAWNGIATMLMEHASVGTGIFVRGAMKTHTTGDGEEKRYYKELIAEDLQIIPLKTL